MPVLPSYRNQSTDLLSKSIDWFYMRATLAFNGLNCIIGKFWHHSKSLLNFKRKLTYCFNICNTFLNRITLVQAQFLFWEKKPFSNQRKITQNKPTPKKKQQQKQTNNNNPPTTTTTTITKTPQHCPRKLL